MRATPKLYKRDQAIYVIGNVAFVADSTTRSAWWKTHAAVAIAACPTCKVPVGQLCVLSFGFHRGNTHGARQHAARQRPATVAMKVILHKDGSP